MTITKTITKVRKDLGENADLFDTKSYAKDSTSKNFQEDYGFVPKSENEILLESRAESVRLKDDYEHAKKQTIREDIDRKKNTGMPTKSFLRSQHIGYYPALKERIVKEKPKKSNLLSPRGQEIEIERVRQKVRSDRLKKKELRIEKYHKKLKQLKSMDRKQRNVQYKIARILQKKGKRYETIEIHGQNVPQAGNILHVQNLFTSSDNRDKSNRDRGNILQAPNYLLKTTKKDNKMRWI